MSDPRPKSSTPPQPRGDQHGSVPLPTGAGFWRRLFTFAGPAYLVSVGYMDPGNWATDIAAGSRFGYALIWVLLASNVMAVLLQSLAARLGIVTRMDLAQACRTMFGRRASFALWVLAEVAIAACDLAEILGSAIGLQLLFGMPLLVGVAVTALDSLLLLVLHSRGVRAMEAFIVTLVATIGVCLGIEIVLSRPAWGALGAGFIPSTTGGRDALYLGIGILGATVMPHNLYLHSGLVQSRRIARIPAGIRNAIRFNFLDTMVALNGAFFVNAALLVMAAAVFHRAGMYGVAEIQDAHRLLEPLLGVHLAPVVLAVALIASGQSSTITGTLAGQIVMEGFLHIRMRPIARRLLTRAVAVVPAVVVILAMGEHATGDLLVLSQVILSLQLSFAVIPLVHLVSDRRWMGPYVVGLGTAAAAWVVAASIAGLNLLLAVGEIRDWLAGAGSWRWLLWVTVVPVTLGLVGLLGYVVVMPAIERRRGDPTPLQPGVHGPVAFPHVASVKLPRRIAVALDFSDADGAVLSYAVTLARTLPEAELVLLHVVEATGTDMLGTEHHGAETQSDRERLELYAAELDGLGIHARHELGFGAVVPGLVRLVEEQGADMVILGAHGHRAVGDFVHGTVVEGVRHRLAQPVLVVPTMSETDAAGGDAG